MFLILVLMAQSALSHAIAVGLFTGLVALGGLAVGSFAQRHWRSVGGGAIALGGDYRLALACRFVDTGLI